MNSIDQRIQAALSEEDKLLLDRYNENQNIFSEIAVSFRGVRGFFVTLVWMLMFVWAGLFVFSAYQFLRAETVDERVLWLGGAMVAFFSLLAVKLWYFMELHRNAFMREFKRLELQISLLTEQSK